MSSALERKIQGNTRGLKPDQRRVIARLMRRRLPPNAWITPSLAIELVELAGTVGRMIGVTIDRRGRVDAVVVGDAVTTQLPALGDFDGEGANRSGGGRLSGLRFAMTAPAGRRLGEHDLALLRRHRLDAMMMVTPQETGTATRVETAYLLPPNPDARPWAVVAPVATERVAEDFVDHVRALEAEFREKAVAGHETAVGDRVLVVATVRDGNERHLAADLAELKGLVRATGGYVVAEVVQRRPQRDPRTLVRGGKVDEINTRALQEGVGRVVFLEELTPSQANNLVDETGLEIVDRTQIILDIFAKRARTREGKIKVELARLRYMLPRLVGQGQSLSRMGGGIGGGVGSNRGVGEKRLERDRRRIKETIERLEGRLEKLKRGRDLRRRKRQRSATPVFALVGYTNAGKTSLINRLTGADERAENRLFSTLETTARRTRLPSHRDVIVTDTVGFIRDLPADLKATFHATLEELSDASILIHVADAADDDAFDKVDAVESLLRELALHRIPRVVVFNKADAIDRAGFAPLLADTPDAMLISSRSRGDVFRLKRRLDDLLDGMPEAPPRRVRREDEAIEEDVDRRSTTRDRHEYVDMLDEEARRAAAPPIEEPDAWGFFD